MNANRNQFYHCQRQPEKQSKQAEAISHEQQSESLAGEGDSPRQMAAHEPNPELGAKQARAWHGAITH